MSRRSTFPLDLFKALEQNDTNRLKDLLSQGGDPNESYDSLTNISLLHMACEKRQIECIHILIEAGADIRKRDDFGMHPMMNAIISQYHDVAEILLSHDPYIVDIQDRYGKAPIHMAVESDSIETVELLVRYGCNIDCYSSSGTTPLMTLCADTNLKNNKHIMDILLAEKPNLEMTDFQCRRTALQYAVIKKNVDAVEALLSAGANTNTIDMVGRTPITNVMWEHVKIYDGSKGIDPDVMMIIVMLIQSGADLNCNKMEYSNPLVTAAFLEAEPLIRFFLEYGCNPNVTFESGVTALLVSVIKNDTESVKTLVQWSCRMDIKGLVYRRGEEITVNPFELAVDNESWDIVQIMANSGYDLRSHDYIIDDQMHENLPKTFEHCPEMLLWLRERLKTPDRLCMIVLNKLWKMFKTGTRNKLSELPLPNRLKETIINGEFLITGTGLYDFNKA